MNLEQFNDLIGHTFASVGGERGGDELRFTLPDGSGWRFYHSQDCCETVAIEDIIGDLSDLVGSPILEAEQVSSDAEPAPESAESFTWTFYRFSTVKGTVTVRWLGTSNGYYSESVSFEEFGNPPPMTTSEDAADAFTAHVNGWLAEVVGSSTRLAKVKWKFDGGDRLFVHGLITRELGELEERLNRIAMNGVEDCPVCRGTEEKPVGDHARAGSIACEACDGLGSITWKRELKVADWDGIDPGFPSDEAREQIERLGEAMSDIGRRFG